MRILTEAEHILYLRILYPIHIQTQKRILHPIHIQAQKKDMDILCGPADNATAGSWVGVGLVN
jgi:hypothetical protein